MPVDSRTLRLVIDAETELARSQLQGLAKTTGLTAVEVDAALTKIERGFDRVEASSRGLNKAGLLAGFAGGLTAGIVSQLPQALIAAAEASIEFAGSLGDQAKKLGVTTKFLQEYYYAAEQTGVKTGQADLAFIQFTKNIGKAADGDKKTRAAFDGIGVSLKDVQGNLKPSEQLFREVADAIAKLPDPARQGAAALKFFGFTGANLLAILKQGSKGFDDFAKSAERLGLILDDTTINSLNDLSSKASDVKKVITVELAAAIGANADAIIRLGQAAAGAIGFLGKLAERYQGFARIRDSEGAGAAFVALGQTGATEQAATPRGYLNRLIDQIGGKRRELAGATGILDGGKRQRLADEIVTLEANKKALIASAEFRSASGGKRPASDTAGAGGDVVDPVAKTPKGRKAPDPAKLALREDRRADAAADAIARAQQALEAAIAAAETDPAKQYAVQRLAIGGQLSEKLDNADREGPGGTKKFNAAEAAQLKALAEQTAAQLQLALNTREAERLGREALDVKLATNASEAEVQQSLLQLADTAAERRSIELKLLALGDAEEEARIDAVMASKQSTEAEKAIAEQRRETLAATRAARVESVVRSTEGPLASYYRSLPDTAAKLGEQVEALEAGALSRLTDDLTDAIVHFKSLADVANSFFDDIVSGIVRIGIQKTIVGPLGDWLFGGASGGGGSGVVGTLFKSLLHFADGGDPPVGVPSLVGERGSELFVPKVGGTILNQQQLRMLGVGGGGGGGGSATVINIDARGASNPAEVDQRVRAGLAAYLPAIDSGIRAGTLDHLRRPTLPGGH